MPKQIHEISNTETELKKSIAYEKKHVLKLIVLFIN